MAKRAKKSLKNSSKKHNPQESESTMTMGEVLGASEKAFLFRKKSLIGDGIAIVAIYIVTLILFWQFVGDNTRFSLSGDSVAAAAWNDVGAEIDQQVDGPPAWNPYVFMGYPTYGSLAFHPDSWINPANWLDVPGRFLFGPNQMNLAIFYFFLSGLLMYLFARGVGLTWWAALFAATVFQLNPYNISLAEAAHLSKHWTISMMPLTLLLTHRVLTKRRLLELSLLALATAALLLSMHAQVAYYALMVGGLYALVWFIREMLKDRRTALIGVGGYAGGTALGLAISAFVYWPVYVFSKFSVRGLGPLRSEGDVAGLDWSYATDWSLHPLESLQFLVPGWFGLGGSSSPDRLLTVDTAVNYNLYWGWMPFTQSSLYMGIISLLLAVLAGVWLWKKNGVVRWMSLAAVLAWVVSFGKFFPVLYWPLYKLLPFFNKFRVPSMAMVITALAVSLLAAYGLTELVKRLIASREDERLRKSVVRLFTVILVVSIAAFALAAFYPGPMDTFLKAGEESRYDAQTLQMLLEMRWQIFAATLLATAFTLAVFALTVRLSVRRKLAFMLPMVIIVAIIFTAYDLITIDKRFLHPVSDRALDNVLAESSTASFLKQKYDDAKEPFRIFPIGNDFQNNYWMYHRIESIGGYSANKLRIYQDMLDYALYSNQGMPNLNIAGMMNGNYLISQQPLPDPFHLVHEDENAHSYVYENPLALPRAWFVDNIVVAEDADEMMEIITEMQFNPVETAVTLENVDVAPVAGDSMRFANVPKDLFTPHSFTVKTSNSQPGFMVLSEIWYPQGWYAKLDDEPVEFIQTDYCLRGLPVPAGEHTITVHYDAPEIKAGTSVSVAALFITLGLLLLSGARVFLKRRGSTGVKLG